MYYRENDKPVIENFCFGPRDNKKNKTLCVAIAAGILLLLILGAFFLFRKKGSKRSRSKQSFGFAFY